MGAEQKRCPECGALEDDPEIGFCAKDGTPLERVVEDLDAGALIGREVAGRYRIIEQIGEGGMGAVYRARQLGIDRDVALKIIRPELARDPGLQARFKREARSASRIQSIRVVTLFDYGQSDDGLMFMAMELLDGESVAERIERDGPLDPVEAVRVTAEVARALEAAHELDVIHRDLKPDNVFLSRKEELVKVLDFGIAKMLGEERRDESGPVTAVGAIIGTPMYMSPEAAAGRGVGPATDLYSLGVMLFEMLTGRPPFLESEPVLLLGMHLKARPPLIRDVAPELAISDALEELVDRLLAKSPEDRPQGASELVRELQELAVAAGEPGATRTPSSWPRADEEDGASAAPTPTPTSEEPGKKSPAVWIGAILAVAALASAAALFASSGDDAVPPAVESVDPPALDAGPAEGNPSVPVAADAGVPDAGVDAGADAGVGGGSRATHRGRRSRGPEPGGAFRHFTVD